MADRPRIAALTRRLADCPAEFLGDPIVVDSDGKRRGAIGVDAVVWDLVDRLGLRLRPDELARFRGQPPQARNRLRLVLVACWLCGDDWFMGREGLGAGVYGWLARGFDELATVVDGHQIIADPDRREEFVRLCLAALAVVPAGESDAEAAERLANLDTVERARVLRDTAAQRRRAEELREKMNSAKARAAAAKPMRE